MQNVTLVPGLEGIAVAETTLSLIDGQKGHLILRGYPIAALSGKVSFAQTCALLWTGKLPQGPEVDTWHQRLGEARVDAANHLPQDLSFLKDLEGMEAMRALTARMSAPKPPEDNLMAPQITGAMAVFAATWYRAQHGLGAPVPDPTLDSATDLLRMIYNRTPDPAQARALDAYLVAVIEHGMNASTFTARVVSSTGSDLVSAVVSAIGALKGPLHGGAPGPVLDMLDAIETPARAESWLRNELAQGRRIMGMGHRVYRVRDPRAAVLERAARHLDNSPHGAERLALARAVEETAAQLLEARYPGRPLRANVEFYTAALLSALALDRTLFSPLFCASRTAGWCAHILEERANGRLIRPRAIYRGPKPLLEETLEEMA